MYVVPVCVVDAAYGYGALIARRSGGSRQSCQSLAVGLIAFDTLLDEAGSGRIDDIKWVSTNQKGPA